jgi:hypothetical protein
MTLVEWIDLAIQFGVCSWCCWKIIINGVLLCKFILVIDVIFIRSLILMLCECFFHILLGWLSMSFCQCLSESCYCSAVKARHHMHFCLIYVLYWQNGLATKIEKSRKQLKERKNRAKKVRGVKKVSSWFYLWLPLDVCYFLFHYFMLLRVITNLNIFWCRLRLEMLQRRSEL